VPWRERLQVLRSVGLGALRRVDPPPEEARLRGRRQTRRRSAVAASHHYDVSSRFYEWILGPSMAYTCALYPEADATLEQAQFAKHDLACRKLGLRPGMRLLDVGCGWGGMVLHAARHYGVQALGVTLSRRQVEWARREIAEDGLAGQAEVRLLDYRDVAETGFEAIASIGLTEHVGKAQLPGVLPVPLGQAAPAWAAAQSLHHPAEQPVPAAVARRLHRPLRVPRRGAARPRPHHLDDG
jgi:cyclopropane-fatty-acyl-phospholipid synthase